MAAGGYDASQQYIRVSDIKSEPLEMLMPIRGFEKMPIVSLEEAVGPLASILPEIKDYVFVAKQRVKPIPDDGLTKDESASIILYSMEWEPHEECLYHALNAALRSEDRRKVKPWFSYLKLVLTALDKLPSLSRTVYRGVKLDLSKEYHKGKTFIWWGFSSCTGTIEVLENPQFLGNSGKRTLFTIECKSGKDISRHSYYKSEKEILLIAARQFTVESTLVPAPGLHMIQLKETKSQIPLISPVTNVAPIKQPIPKPIHVAKPKPQEFATPGTYKELRCNGRPCARCGKCRDWYFTGDAATLTWLRSVTDWSFDGAAEKRWCNDQIYKQFKPRSSIIHLRQ